MGKVLAMNYSDYSVLMANVIAIVNQAFAMQCGEFAINLASDQHDFPGVDFFDQERHIAMFDFQEVLGQGYGALSDLQDEIQRSWEAIPEGVIDDALNKLPDSLPDIAAQLNRDEFVIWLRYALDREVSEPLYLLHHAIQGSMGGGFQYDEVHDAIREVIAFDDISPLENLNVSVSAEMIEVEDVITAITIRSMKAFAYLHDFSSFSIDEYVEILSSCSDDKDIFFEVCSVICPTQPRVRELITSVEVGSNSNLHALLNEWNLRF